MTTAVDTNILLDIWKPDPFFLTPSKNALRNCRDQGRLIACDVVWAESSAHFDKEPLLHRAMELLSVEFSELEQSAAIAAGETWRKYRRDGGKRDRIIADFLVGAHALLQADRLLTRDRGFYKSYFPSLKIIDPSP